MFHHWRMLLSIFEAPERMQIYMLLGGASLLALIEIAGVASVMPFIAVVLDPAVIDENRYVNAAYRLIGFDDHMSFQVFLGVVALVMLVVSNAFSAFQAWFVFRFCFMRTQAVCVRLLDIYLRQRWTDYLQRSRAEMQKIIVTDVDRVVVGTLMAGIGIFADTVSALFMLAVLVLVDPMVTASTLLALGLAYGVVFLSIRRRVTRLGQECVALTTDIVSRTQEALEGAKEIKVGRREQEFVRRLQEPRHRFAMNAIRYNTLDLIPSRVIEVIAFGIIVAMTLYYLLHLGTSNGVVAIIALYAFAAYRLIPKLKALFDGVDTVRYNAPALEVICRDFDPSRRARESRATSAPLALTRGIEFDDVAFSYPGNRRPAVQGLTMRIPMGELVCVTGPTGAGKSTAIDLMLGVLRPDAGQVLVDGVPLGAGTIRAWQGDIGYVPQTISLLDDTVAANIAFGARASDIDLARVERAAQLAQIHDFVVRELPSGYESRIGEGGQHLSGGQRQRLGLARALYADPQVLVLDEATNALDLGTERALFDALRALTPARTIVCISHKESVARRADRVLVISGGRLEAEGRFDEMASRSGGLFLDT